MKRSKVLMDKNIVINQSGVIIYKEANNTYSFECNNNNNRMKYFITNDTLEAVSSFIKIKEADLNESIWSIKITQEMKTNINYKKSLYWITGGDYEWSSCDSNYKKDWINCEDVFYNEFTPTLKNIIKEANTLGDIKHALVNNVNLPTIYEFALSEKMLK